MHPVTPRTGRSRAPGRRNSDTGFRTVPAGRRAGGYPQTGSMVLHSRMRRPAVRLSRVRTSQVLPVLHHKRLLPGQPHRHSGAEPAQTGRNSEHQRPQGGRQLPFRAYCGNGGKTAADPGDCSSFHRPRSAAPLSHQCHRARSAVLTTEERNTALPRSERTPHRSCAE